MANAPSKDSDQPGHPPSLIRVFAVRMKKAWVLSYPLSAQQRLWSEWADAQTDLSLRWAHSHFVCFVMRRLIYVRFKVSLYSHIEWSNRRTPHSWNGAINVLVSSWGGSYVDFRLLLSNRSNATNISRGRSDSSVFFLLFFFLLLLLFFFSLRLSGFISNISSFVGGSDSLQDYSSSQASEWKWHFRFRPIFSALSTIPQTFKMWS